MPGSSLATAFTRTDVNVHISDLFFNRDLDHCRILERGEFVRWNEDDLAEEAQSLLMNLDSLGVPNLPSADELIADFVARC
jgi:hypothetical protein